MRPRPLSGEQPAVGPGCGGMRADVARHLPGEAGADGDDPGPVVLRMLYVEGAALCAEVADPESCGLPDAHAGAPEDPERHGRPWPRPPLGNGDYPCHLLLRDDPRHELRAAPDPACGRNPGIGPLPPQVDAELPEHQVPRRPCGGRFAIPGRCDLLGAFPADHLRYVRKRREIGRNVPERALRALGHPEAEALPEPDIILHEPGIGSAELDHPSHSGTSSAMQRSDSVSIDR